MHFLIRPVATVLLGGVLAGFECGAQRHEAETVVATPAADAKTNPVPQGSRSSQVTAAMSQGRLIIGDAEIVMTRDGARCSMSDNVDISAHAVRLSEGVMLLAGNAPETFALFGSDLEHLRRRCTPIFKAVRSQDPATFKNRTWVMAVYREGDTLHALLHNEFHDARASGCLHGDDSARNPCWYNAITYAFSVDGGRHFEYPRTGTHVVAAPPLIWDTAWAATRRGSRPMYGYFAPSNIVKRGGFYFAAFRSIPGPARSNPAGVCIMRTSSLSQPEAWRAWDGSGFALAMPSPYNAGAGRRSCMPVIRGWTGLTRSLTYSEQLGKYVLVGTDVHRVGKTVECGVFATESRDLITWEIPHLLVRAALNAPLCGRSRGTSPLLYPSLIDPADTSINFERIGEHPYLYYVSGGADRALMRTRMTLR